MRPWTCLVSHAINIVRPISMKFIRSTLNYPKYEHTKNHINPKRLSYKFWYWTKTAITFGEECVYMINLHQKMRFYHNQLIMISSNNGKYGESTFFDLRV